MRIFIRLIFSFFSKSGVTHVTDTISETEWDRLPRPWWWTTTG